MVWTKMQAVQAAEGMQVRLLLEGEQKSTFLLLVAQIFISTSIASTFQPGECICDEGWAGRRNINSQFEQMNFFVPLLFSAQVGQ